MSGWVFVAGNCAEKENRAWGKGECQKQVVIHCDTFENSVLKKQNTLKFSLVIVLCKGLHGRFLIFFLLLRI